MNEPIPPRLPIFGVDNEVRAVVDRLRLVLEVLGDNPNDMTKTTTRGIERVIIDALDDAEAVVKAWDATWEAERRASHKSTTQCA